MLLVGDILAILSFFVAGGVTLWGCLVACGLLYPDRVRIARERVEARPWKTFFVGVLVFATLGTLAAALSAAPPPPVKIIGAAMLLALICISFLGTTGVAVLAADRIGKGAPNLPPYATLSRGAGYIVLPSLLPFIGWFFIAPVFFLVGLGAGWSAAVAKLRRQPQYEVQ